MQNSPRVRRWIPWTILGIGFLGFVDAAYLTAKHYQGEAPNCVFFTGCDIVTTSTYAVLFGVPVALLGALFYLAVFLLAIGYVAHQSEKFLTLIFYLSIPAMLFTLYLVYLQLFVIEATCVYCMFSALTSGSIFACSLRYYLDTRKERILVT